MWPKQIAVFRRLVGVLFVLPIVFIPVLLFYLVWDGEASECPRWLESSIDWWLK